MTSAGRRPRIAALVPWRRGAERPLVLGHRGARVRAPENTLPAFELAVQEGADGVELDVRLDERGELIVFHDRRLERMTRGVDDRDVESVDPAALARVDLGGGARVPRLEEVLAWARARGTRVNIELKADVSDPRRLVHRLLSVLRSQPSEHLLISSFHPGLIRHVTERRPVLPTGLLLHPRERRAPRWRRLGAVAVHPHWSTIDAAHMQRWALEGAIVNTWTVNDGEQAKLLAKLGVNALITDDPAKVLGDLRTLTASQG